MRATANEVQAIRVLLVEDEFLISEWVAETLVVEQGFAVHAVTNAADALRYLGAMPVDVLFTDVICRADSMALCSRAAPANCCLTWPWSMRPAASTRSIRKTACRAPLLSQSRIVPALIGRVLANAAKARAELLPA